MHATWAFDTSSASRFASPICKGYWKRRQWGAQTMRLTRTSDPLAARVAARRPRRFGLLTAALCAVATAGCVVAVLGAVDARLYGLSATEAAAAIAAASLLVGVLGAVFMARRRGRSEAASWHSDGEQQ